MVRTDLVFRINREKQDGMKPRRRGLGCALVCVFLTAAAATLAVIFSDTVREHAARVVPWIQSKGRVAMGDASLIPVRAVIDRSEMTQEQKLAAKDLLDDSWRKAEESKDAVYRREDIINLARQLTESLPGLYYALGLLRDKGVDHVELSALQKKMADRLFAETMEDIAGGRIAPSLIEEFRKGVHLLILDVKMAGTDPEDIEKAEARLRALLKDLYTINKSRSQLPEGSPVDMPNEMLSAMRQFREGLEKSRTRKD